MAYSKDYREGIIKLLKSGETLEKLHKTLGISISAMEEWKNKERNGEDLGNAELKRKARKFHEKELKELIKNKPDITLEEIAKHFKGAISSAFYACERNKITLKKKK
jgi:transposase